MLTDEVERVVRQEIPAEEVRGLMDNVGIPASSINLSYNDSGLLGTGDADILVSLRAEHRPTALYVERLRARLNRAFPGMTFYFLPADIVSQSINFGLPAPFDIQVVGRDQTRNREVAARLAERIRRVPGAVDVRVQQPADLPKFEVAVDRTKASEMGLFEVDAANALLLSLSGSGQVQPVFWIDPKVGIQYLVAVRVPQYQIDSLSTLGAIPVNASRPGQGDAALLANLATVTRTNGPAVISHYNIMPVIDVYGGVSGRDLGGLLRDLKPLIAQAERELPKGSFITLRGQAETMHSSFAGLGMGMVMAMVLIYLLLVVNFQSWLDPFIIITALPGALAGVAWALHLTLTTVSVPALMGAIMSLGVATANSVLVVTFARNGLGQGLDPARAAWEAGVSRLRPVLMTASAMVIGMFPMALALGEGGEQNAPLGRAVIGGLIVATLATLFFVPLVFGILHRHAPAAAPAPEAAASAPPLQTPDDIQAMKECLGTQYQARRIHPGGMEEGSRGSKRSETPGSATACAGIPEGCQRAACPGRVRLWHPVPGCGVPFAAHRGSRHRRDPRLPSGNPPGCPACAQGQLPIHDSCPRSRGIASGKCRRQRGRAGAEIRNSKVRSSTAKWVLDIFVSDFEFVSDFGFGISDLRFRRGMSLLSLFRPPEYP